MYNSTITFNFDTICPWTYLGKLRLDKALTNYRSNNPNSPVNFTVQLAPYQLYPAMAASGEPKREWQTERKYHGDTVKFDVFALTMNQYAEPLGFKFNWDGEIANTLEAHRVIQVFQGGEDFDDIADTSGTSFGKKYGPAVATKILDALYRAFFQESKHPSAEDTLLQACKEAGVEDADARRVVVEEKDLGATETKRAIQMVGMNGVDSVPTVVFEGRRRDFTLVGAKEVEEYEKTLAAIVKESS